MYWFWLSKQDRNERGEFASGDGGGGLPEKYAIPKDIPEVMSTEIDYRLRKLDEVRSKLTSMTGFSPEQLTGLIARGTGLTAALYHVYFLGQTGVGVTWMLHNSSGDAVGKVTRDFDTDTITDALEVDHVNFEIDENIQSSGIGRAVLGNMMAVYQRAGVTAIKIYAGLTVGGYAWAKYGFTPTQKSWDSLRSDMKTPWAHDEKVSAVLANSDPKGIWKIADSKTPTEERPTSNGKNTVGKLALMGRDWRGELRLDDKSAMSRFNKYLGDEVKKADVVHSIARLDEADVVHSVARLDEAEIAMRIIEEIDG